MDSFLKTILIILLVYFGLRILIQFAKPYILKYLAKKLNQRFENAFGQNPFQSNRASESYNHTKQNTSKIPKSKKVVGEYIDFEEVE